MIKYFCKNCNINVESSECSVCGARTEVESKLYWCSTCNIPVYDEVCPICGCKGEYFTSDARPVFPEERLLIEIMLGKPFCFIEDSVWNGSGNRYYVNGKKIPFSVTNLKNYDPDAIREKLDELKGQNTREQTSISEYSLKSRAIKIIAHPNPRRLHLQFRFSLIWTQLKNSSQQRDTPFLGATYSIKLSAISYITATTIFLK